MASYDDTAVVSGSVVSFADGADDVPTKSLVVTIPPTLSGVSSVTETQTERNLLLPSNADIAETTVNGIKRSYSLDNQEFTFDGTNTKTDASWLIFSINAIDFALNGLKTGVTYRFSHNLTADMYAQFTYNKSGGGVGAMGYLRGNAGQNASVSFTLPSDFSSLKQFQIGVSNTAGTVNITAHFQVEFGSTAHDFEPYQTPTQYTANLGRTIYGGEVDIVNGEGREICGKIVFDGSSDENWTAYAGGNGYLIAIADMERGTWYTSEFAGSSPLPKVPDNNSLGVRIGVNNNGVYVVQANTIEGVTDIASFKAWLSENPLTIIYPLDVTEDFTFTGQEIPTRKGYNAFWSEQGNTELTYYKSGYGFTSVTVNKTGKNLFDISKVATTGTTAGISWSVSGNEITISGTATSSGWKTLVDFKLPHKGTYHFHMNATGNVGYFLRGWTQLVGKDVTEVCNDPSQTYRIAIAVATSGQSYSGTISEIQIEVGDSYTEYEPYEAVSKTAYLHKVIYGGQADVIRGTCEPKNLIELYTRASHNGVNYSINADGSLHREGTASPSTSFNNGNAATYSACPYKLSKGTYTITVSGNQASGGYLSFGMRKTDDTQLTSIAVTGNTSKTFTVDEDVGAWYWISLPNGVSANDDIYVQLEKGSESTEHAPYFEPFTFPPISMETDEGENTLFANEGASAITYRKETD